MYRGADNPGNPHERPLGAFLRSLLRPFTLDERGYEKRRDGSIAWKKKET